jgi:hypothetical protein
LVGFTAHPFAHWGYFRILSIGFQRNLKRGKTVISKLPGLITN